MASTFEPTTDPQIGDLATPLNSSSFSKAFINNLPAYRQGLSPQRRGLEVGMAHGFFLFGPLTITGPLRNTPSAAVAGVLGAVGLVIILTIALSLYASAAKDNPSANLGSKESWSEFAGSFLVGGCGGAFFAYLIYLTPHLDTLNGVAKAIWSVG